MNEQTFWAMDEHSSPICVSMDDAKKMLTKYGGSAYTVQYDIDGKAVAAKEVRVSIDHMQRNASSSR